ncbi:MAG TPA: hypothetical protein VMY42_00485 [Thermoguttaceae bacterium]|nr:hypothetical protein [Thermoguttaceae bacterium]
MSRTRRLARVALLSVVCGTLPGVSRSAEPDLPAALPLASIDADLQRALAQPITAEFIETPLKDVVQYIRETFRLNVVLDRRALDKAGISLEAPLTFRVENGTLQAFFDKFQRTHDLAWTVDPPVTLDVSNVSLHTALELVLDQLGLAWRIEGPALRITGPDDWQVITRLYPVGDLVTCRDPSGELWDDYDSLISVIRTATAKSWDEFRGVSSIAGATFGKAKFLAVVHTDAVHYRIARTLAELRASAARQPGAGEPPLRKRPSPPGPPRTEYYIDPGWR